ncbi:hypothetical protein ABTH70_19440, partial [Acinetobacter baumannii]
MAIGEQFSNDDYQDCWHLVGVGGRRLAPVVAPPVPSISQQLGYHTAPSQHSSVQGTSTDAPPKSTK